VRHLRLSVVLCVLIAAFALPGVASAAPGDMDNDTVPDAIDNCPTVYNIDAYGGPGPALGIPQDSDGQFDSDGDGVGNSCDPTPGVPANASTTIIYHRDVVTGGPLGVLGGPRCVILSAQEFENGQPLGPPRTTACFRRFNFRTLTAPALSTEYSVLVAPPGCRPLYSSPIVVRYNGGGTWTVINVFYLCDDTLLDLPPEVLLQMVLSGQITIADFQRAIQARYFPPAPPSPRRR